MLKTICCITFNLIAQCSFAQQKTFDSLLNELKKHPQEDTSRLNLIIEIAFQYSGSNPDKGIEAANDAIDLAFKLKYKAKLASAYDSKGANYHSKDEDSLALQFYKMALTIYQQMDNWEKMGNLLYNVGLIYQKSDYYKALEYHNNALTVFQQVYDSKNIANCYRIIGVDYHFLSNYPRALESLQKALVIYEKSGDEGGIAGTFTDMGLVYTYLSDFEKALEYHQKAFSIFEQLNNKRGMADELGNMGNVYDNIDDSSMALRSYQKALDICKAMGYKEGVASNLINIGIVYNYYDNYPEALEYLLKALHMYEQSGNKSNMSVALNEIAKIYLNCPEWLLAQQGVTAKDRYNKVIEYQERSLQLAKKTGSVMSQAFAWESLSATYEKQKDFSRALNAYKQGVNLKDSSLNNKNNKEITRLEMQFEFDKKEALNKAENDKKHALALAEINKQKVIRNASISIGAILLAVAIAGIVLYKRRKDILEKKKESEFSAKVADTELKALRSQMNPHFIFNSLNSINDYIDKHDTAKATFYTTSFAKLMRMILENSEKKEIPIADDLMALELYMQLEALRLGNKFTYHVKVDEDIDQENTLIPPLILQPFVENSIWHGIAKKQGVGKIFIYIHKEGNMINCIVEDNGIGLSESARAKTGKEMESKKSFGMKITRARIDIMNIIKKSNAAVTLSDLDEGTRVEIKLPEALAF
jgi:tetratricopeptide (TPR) repeat protein